MEVYQICFFKSSTAAASEYSSPSSPGEGHEDELGVHHVTHLRARHPGFHRHQGDQLLPEQRGRHHVPCGHPDDQQTLEDLRLQQVGILGCCGDGRLFFLTWWGLNVALKFAKDQRFGGVVEDFVF